MLMPSIFGEDLFDNFMKDFPFFDDNAESNVEKKLYGRRAVSYTHLESWKQYPSSPS